MSAEKFLSDFREGVKAFIEADPWFLGIEIVNERLKDLSAKLDEKLAVLGGIAIVLVTPSVGGVLRNVGGANFEKCLLVARVLESLDLNDTGKEALDTAVYLAALLNGAKPDTFGNPLVPTEPCITLGNDPKYLSYDVAFTTSGGAVIDTPRLPAITASAGNPAAITLAQAIPGAAVFYTTADSQPIPRNPASVLYTGPFAAASGTKVRARAWLAGFLPSPELTFTV